VGIPLVHLLAKASVRFNSNRQCICCDIRALPGIPVARRGEVLVPTLGDKRRHHSTAPAGGLWGLDLTSILAFQLAASRQPTGVQCRTPLAAWWSVSCCPQEARGMPLSQY
jgi:hypothetical protein